MLSLHDSASRTRVPFQPADPAHVRMYVCGPTVYDLPHLGNVRSTVVFDVLARLLRALYPRVTYVRTLPTWTTRSPRAPPNAARPSRR